MQQITHINIKWIAESTFINITINYTKEPSISLSV
jgi:hypothetical protein